MLPEIVLTFHCLNKLFMRSQNFCKFSAFRISLITRTVFFTVGQNNFGNKIPFLSNHYQYFFFLIQSNRINNLEIVFCGKHVVSRPVWIFCSFWQQFAVTMSQLGMFPLWDGNHKFSWLFCPSSKMWAKKWEFRCS